MLLFSVNSSSVCNASRFLILDANFCSPGASRNAIPKVCLQKRKSTEIPPKTLKVLLFSPSRQAWMVYALFFCPWGENTLCFVRRCFCISLREEDFFLSNLNFKISACHHFRGVLFFRVRIARGIQNLANDEWIAREARKALLDKDLLFIILRAESEKPCLHKNQTED